MGPMPSSEDITRHSDVDPAGVTWIADRPVARPIEVVDPSPSWPADFAALAGRIRDALGHRVVALDHVGSTSVPGLPAKPIIDIDLTVADAGDEASYVPALQREGFVFLLREPGWHGHRLLTAAAPPANVHVWSPSSPEAIRHQLLRDWLCEHATDRERYAAAKRAAAVATNLAGEDVTGYTARKEGVIREILDRAFHAAGLS
jgi:GrpB-like predicted nucleotidyltransferase (UPF0157 family)